MPNTFTYNPTYGASEVTKPRVLVTTFGDGYEQRVVDGINHIRRVWNLTFSKTGADMAAVISFLENEGGVTSFNWTPPRGSAGLWVCREWSRAVNDAFDQVTLQFVEVFE